jgi:hypothetical protein
VVIAYTIEFLNQKDDNNVIIRHRHHMSFLLNTRQKWDHYQQWNWKRIILYALQHKSKNCKCSKMVVVQAEAPEKE